MSAKQDRHTNIWLTGMARQQVAWRILEGTELMANDSWGSSVSNAPKTACKLYANVISQRLASQMAAILVWQQATGLTSHKAVIWVEAFIILYSHSQRCFISRRPGACQNFIRKTACQTGMSTDAIWMLQLTALMAKDEDFLSHLAEYCIPVEGESKTSLPNDCHFDMATNRRLNTFHSSEEMWSLHYSEHTVSRASQQPASCPPTLAAARMPATQVWQQAASRMIGNTALKLTDCWRFIVT